MRAARSLHASAASARLPFDHSRASAAFRLPRAVALAAACLALNAQAASLQAAADALQVDGTRSLSFDATGHWFQFGQAPAPTLPWPIFNVSRYTADVRYDVPAARVRITRIQAVEKGRNRPKPVEQQVDQLMNGDTAWNLPSASALAAPVPPGGQPPQPTAHPAAVEERQAEIWTTPHGFLKAALAGPAATRPVKGGLEVAISPDGRHRYVGFINKKNQLDWVRTWIDNPVTGDTPVELRYGQYASFDGVRFPTYIERLQGGHPVLTLKVSDVRLNTDEIIVAPEGLTPPKVTVTATPLAEGVTYLTGGTHHSVVIEQKDHLVLVEAPLNEARSLALLDKLKELYPNKPLKTVINTHAHFDHSGGLRTFVDAGAVIVTHQANAAYYQRQWAQPRTLNPDRLAQSGRKPQFETLTGRHVLTDGQRDIEIHPLPGNSHNDAFVFVWLPKERLLIEADAYTPTPANAPLPTPPNPYSVNLYETIRKLKLPVQQIAALHGPRVATLDDLRAAIGQAGDQTADQKAALAN